jgi:acetylornithine/succinyldiaminopimelate/putrescine aminotransferase
MNANIPSGVLTELHVPASEAAEELISRERTFGARNYDPLPVVLARGEGSFVFDVDGRRYLDLMSAYSAVSFGHAHPKIVGALIEQAQKLGVTSRAYFNNRLPPLFERLAQLTSLDRVLPSNGGAEAVETAIKAARKWGYKIKGIPDGHAEIIACRNNFHGRTITITGLSTEPQYRDGFGPFPRRRRAGTHDRAQHGGVFGRARARRRRHDRAAARVSRAMRADLSRASRLVDLR